MGTQKLCTCDQTRQNLIRVDIELIDTVKQPFATIVKDLSGVTHKGFWLNPFRGIPHGPSLSRFDVVYLDENCRVLEYARNFAEVEFVPIRAQAASALILPTHSITSSHIQEGDQLRICSGSKALAGFDESAPPIEAADSFRCSRKSGLLGSGLQKRNHELQVTKTETSQQGVTEEPTSLMVRFLRWVFPPALSDRRRDERMPAQGIVAYHWTGGAPQAYQLGNVSQSGLYMLTEERWIPGTRIVMTLQRAHIGEAHSEDIHPVESQVVRWGVNGVGFAFGESGLVDLNSGEIVEDQKFDRVAFEQFLLRAQRPASGAASPRPQ